MGRGFRELLISRYLEIQLQKMEDFKLRLQNLSHSNQDFSSRASSLWLSCNHHPMENALNIIKKQLANATWVRLSAIVKKKPCLIEAIGREFIENLILSRNYDFIVVCGHVNCSYFHKGRLSWHNNAGSNRRHLEGVRNHQEAIIKSKRSIVSEVQAISATPAIASHIADRKLQVTGCLFLQDTGTFAPCLES